MKEQFLLEKYLTTKKFNETIEIINCDVHLYTNYTYENIIKNSKIIRIHEIFKNKQKKNI